MTDNNKQIYKSIPQSQIDDLTAIYDDYLYVARMHEQLLQLTSIDELAVSQMEDMHPDYPKLPWQLRDMTAADKKNFADFIDNNVYNQNKTYIVLQHIKSEENNATPPVFAIPPYIRSIMNMQLPSPIERYTLIYPENSKLGDTEFYIDGHYKAVYTDRDTKDQLLKECLNDPKMLTELCIMVNISENLHKNKFTSEKLFERASMNIFAAEVVATNENIILEILGSFAEKVQSICRDRYNLYDGREALKQAQKEGLIHSAEDFQDYVNIRNFMRHQWETLDELGYFSAIKSYKNETTRAEFLNSYLKLCDKSIVQRMKSYIDILHQMQSVIAKVNPNRIIRDTSESNNKFIKRLKSLEQPQHKKIELNYPLASDKYKSLNQSLHKIMPNLSIADDFPPQLKETKLADINTYNTRSWFLQYFHFMDCLVMRHCIMRGQDLKKHKAWKYLKTSGVISQQEFNAWQDYTRLRNDLSHNYFDEKLRNRLNSVQEKYSQDSWNISHRLNEISPDVKKISDNVYEYIHNDGLVVRLDFKHHSILQNNQSITQAANRAEIVRTTPKSNGDIQKEIMPNGVVYNIADKEIVGIKFPNGIHINFNNMSIHWDTHTHWYANADVFNILQTDKSKIFTDKDLSVNKYYEKNKRIPFRAGDNLLIDHRHNVLLDSSGRIKEFKFKSYDGTILRANFKHTREHGNLISFADGTNILQSGSTMLISHNGKTLTFANRAEFAATYDNKPIMHRPITKSNSGR